VGLFIGQTKITVVISLTTLDSYN